MKILLFNDSCKEGGGAETYIFAVSKFLSKKHDIFLFSYGDADIRERNKVVVAHSRSKLKRNFDKFSFNFKVYSELRKYLKDIKPDIAFLHNNYVYSIPVLLALAQEKIPTLQTVHDWGQICPSSWCVIKKNLKRCKGVEGISPKCLFEDCIKPGHFFLTYLRNRVRIKFSKKIIKQFISPSRMLAKDLIKHDFKNVHCVHHFKEFENSKLDLAKSKNGLIIYVGVLSMNKGVDFLIRAFKNVTHEYPDALLTIIGDGPERATLEKLAKDLKIDSKIEFKGKIQHSEVIREFEKCRLFVLPSVWMENSPFVIYECMSVGRPIVGSNRGGIPDLVLDGKTGFIVEPAKPEKIAKAILKILNDDKIFKKFSKNAFNYIHTKLTVEKHMDALEKVFQNVKKNSSKQFINGF